MLVKNKDPKEIAEALLNRSVCAVQVSAVLADHFGIFSWGINHAGPDGFGEHAEIHALSRCNRRRLSHATMYVAAQRQRNGKAVTAKPCEACQVAVRFVREVVWRDNTGEWKVL